MSKQSIIRSELIIEPSDLVAKLGNKHLRIFDATVVTNQGAGQPSALDSYLSGHIPGAAFLDQQRLADKNSVYQLMVPAAEELAVAFGELGISQDSEVVVYATTVLAWATRVWWVLRYAGFKNVRVLNGGLSGWQAAGGDIETVENIYAADNFEIDIESDWFVGKDEVLAALRDDRISTVNTLPESAYDQAHISGSTCVPCSNFLDNWSRLLPNEELKERLGEFSPDKKIITYCGGGGAATVNAVVHKLVGNPNVAVYDGSMSEWTGEGLPLTRAGD